MQKELPAVDQATDYVNELETVYVNMLFAWETDAEHRAKNCGCPQCLREAKRVSAAIGREVTRLNDNEWDDSELPNT
jgi:hypothetical protein